MSASAQTLRNGSDTFAWSSGAQADEPHGDSKQLRLQTGVAEAFLYFNPSFPDEATIVSAILRVYTKGSWGISPTLTVQRINANWSTNRLTWNNRPGVAGVTATLVKSSAVDGDEWAIDVTPILQAVADGSKWYGFKITTSSGTLKSLYSHDAIDFRPTLDVSWSEAPRAPSTLSPAGGRAVSIAKPVLRFDFTDLTGSTTMQALQVQANATNTFVDPSYDSGAVLASEPEFDLNTASYVRTASVTKTGAANPNLTGISPPLAQADVGAPITGTGIPGGTTIASVGVGGTTAVMSANASSSGTITATITRTYPGITNATATFWRVRVQDSAGLWSAWSDPATFRRDNKGTLTISNPSSGTPTVTEWTPPIIWSLSGETQTAYRVEILAADDTTVVLYDSGRTKSTATTVTIPKGVLVDGSSYVVRVRIWDSKDRESTPGDPPYTLLERTFTFAESGTVTTVTSLTATALTLLPYVDLAWSRATAPDAFNIKRDGVVIEAKVPAADLLVSGTNYAYRDKDARRGVAHTWVVQAVVNGVTSNANPSAAATVSTVGIWLVELERGIEFVIANTDGSQFGMGETGATYSPVGSSRNVRITQGLRGLEGTITGLLVDMAGKTAAEWEDVVQKIRSRPGRDCVLHVGKESIRCKAFNIAIAPYGGPPTTQTVTFEFFQIGALDYATRL